MELDLLLSGVSSRSVFLAFSVCPTLASATSDLCVPFLYCVPFPRQELVLSDQVSSTRLALLCGCCDATCYPYNSLAVPSACILQSRVPAAMLPLINQVLVLTGFCIVHSQWDGISGVGNADFGRHNLHGCFQL